jgi:adenylate kinase family enzyme
LILTHLPAAPVLNMTALPLREAQEYDYISSPLGEGNEPVLGDVHNQFRALWDEVQTLKLKLLESEGEQKTELDGLGAESIRDGESHDQPSRSTRKTIIPETRRVNYHHYKNLFGSDNRRYAIDVLWSGPLLEKVIQREMQDRLFVNSHKNAFKNKKVLANKLATNRFNIIDKAVHRSDANTEWIQRVRINSPALLDTLARLCGERWSTLPRSFSRPFKLIIHLQEKVRDVLKNLEERPDVDGISTPADSASQVSTAHDHKHIESEISHFISENNPDAINDIRCYVKFVDEEIIPLHRKWENADSSSSEELLKIRFDDLWYLFRTGDLVRWTEGSETLQQEQASIRQSTWRVFALHTPLDRYKVRPLDHRKFVNDEIEGDEFRLRCYYIDWTGEDFCAVTEEFKIPRYEGERPVNKLGVYPLRFVRNASREYDRLFQQGQDFLDCIQERHRIYNWWTNRCDPRGVPVTDADGNEIKHAQHIHSDVIVDFIEAFQVCPAWKPRPANLQPVESDSLTTADEVLIREYDSSENNNMLSETPEILQLKGGVEEWDRNKHIHEDEFLRSLRESASGIGRSAKYEFRDEDKFILPSRVFAYVLRERRFAQLDARHLKKVTAMQNGFDNLKIDRNNKKLIQVLVDSHFSNKRVEREHGVEGINQDLIIGKGRGLVILLHGVPGVGKTATAEAVAQISGKPLFPITCGDLGTSPKEVEAALQEIFRLASLWDAILLLDEVDTFFSQRSRQGSDIVRNALVSVFLRALEYYNGILFLTTNRTGTLDEAFKSRVQVKVYYPPLEEEQTMEIWEMNINRLRVIDLQRSTSTEEPPLQIFDQDIMNFARQHYREHSSKGGNGRWNGRQIRNAFQIASALAYYDHRDKHQRLRLEDPDAKPSAMPVLGVEHFKTMADLTTAFDEYLLDTLGTTYGDLAYDLAERRDDHDWRAQQQKQRRDPGPGVPVSPEQAPNYYYQGSRSSWDDGAANMSPLSSRVHDQGYEGSWGRREQPPQQSYGRNPPAPSSPELMMVNQRDTGRFGGPGGRPSERGNISGNYGSSFTGQGYGYGPQTSEPGSSNRAPTFGGNHQAPPHERDSAFGLALEKSGPQW